MRFLIWLSTECKSLAEVAGAIKQGGHEVGILLVQDGVFLADKGCSYSEELAPLGVPVYVSREHVEARGIADRLAIEVEFVDYPQMAELIMEQYDRVICF